MIARATISVLLSLVVLGPSLSQDGSDVNRKGDRVIRRGDRVVWIGNTLAERMQYYGEVESRLHARYPQHELVVRNLSWSADTVIRRRRPKGFGDIHRYLSNAKADVILACYGLTETWDYDGQKGVAKFRDDLTKFLRSLLGQKYNGESAPRIVLYSPIACEPGRLPDFAERLRLLELYSLAMKETAAAQSVAFVDLFTPSRQLFRASSKPTHTINGIHLTADGYTKLADAFFPDSLFAALPAAAPLDAIRTEVLEKNDSFFKWYRTVNSFYIHGDRARPYGVVNFPAERKKLLEMTTLRDRRIWKAARGEVLPTAVDDSSTTKVPQAIRGTRGGVSPALSPAAEREKFVVAEGFRVELFASEKEFPELRNP
ncbi:MAG: SGNH/GDSL hydrolase family protein, partial [Planctomycetota bacterium]